MMTKVVHDTDIGSGLEISGGKVNVAATMATDAEVAAAIASALGGGPEPNLVFVDTNNPNTATVFDDANPPVANDPTLPKNSQYLYVGADGSQWTWNGTAYISSPSGSTTVGIGSSAAITRIFPVSPSGTLLSTKVTGLFKFEGLRFDIRWTSAVSYHITLVNTTAAPITINGNAYITNSSSSGIYIATVIAAGGSQHLLGSGWDVVTIDECVANIAVNGKWYVLRTLGYPSGTSRTIHMELERKL